MELTTPALARFNKAGQMEINTGRDLVLRGGIDIIWLGEGAFKAIRVRFVWMAERVSSEPRRWVNALDNCNIWEIPLLNFRSRNIGPCVEGSWKFGGECLRLEIDESRFLVLIPPDSGEILDPEKVENLRLKKRSA